MFNTSSLHDKDLNWLERYARQLKADNIPKAQAGLAQSLELAVKLYGYPNKEAANAGLHAWADGSVRRASAYLTQNVDRLYASMSLPARAPQEPVAAEQSEPIIEQLEEAAKLYVKQEQYTQKLVGLLATVEELIKTKRPQLPPTAEAAAPSRPQP